jgi:pimeloyl-ACP methyl ester carboxylesterase
MEQKKSRKKTRPPFLLRFVSWVFPKLEAVAPSLAHRYFIYIFSTPLHYKVPEKEREFMRSASEFSVRVDGTYIQCYRWGDAGPKVIMIHGWAGRAGQFRKMIPELASSGFQVIAFDGPAHGKSEGKQTDLLQFGNVLKKIIEVEGAPVGMIAHSFGGIAAMYAIGRGLPVRKLINISSPTIASQVVRNFRRAVNASKAAGDYFERYWVAKFGGTFEEFSGLHIVTQLPGPLDLLHIQDDNDPEVATDNATELKKAYPAATVHITKGLGHTRILKDDEVIALCVKFLKS